MTTLIDLYNNRCDENGNPLYWIPRETERTPLCLYTDPAYPVKPKWGVAEAISRSLAVNRLLEVEGAGFFVGQAIQKNQVPKHSKIIKLLQSNIKDETFHQRGIENLCSLYHPNPDDQKEAETMAQRWQECAGQYHPLLPVAVLEIGSFMVNLAFWRVFGGEAFASAAREIAKDENRHAVTNRSLLSYFNQPYWDGKLLELTRETVGWIYEPLNVPSDLTPEFEWSKDNLIQAALDLVQTGESRSLTEVSRFGDYFAHFETDKGYARAPA